MSHFLDCMAWPDWMPEKSASMTLVLTPRSLASQFMKSMSKPTMLPLASCASKGGYGSEVQTVSVPEVASVALAASMSAWLSAAGAGTPVWATGVSLPVTEASPPVTSDAALDTALEAAEAALDTAVDAAEAALDTALEAAEPRPLVAVEDGRLRPSCCSRNSR